MHEPLNGARRNYELFSSILDRLNADPTPHNIKNTINELCAFLGLDGWTWIFVSSIGEILELDTRPSEWKNQYDDGLFFYNDPVVQTAVHTDQPFTWDSALQVRKLTGSEFAVMNQARDHGIKEGCNFPIHDISNDKGCLSFYSDDLQRIWDVWAVHRDLLGYVSLTVHQIHKQLKNKGLGDTSKRKLAPGEAAVLSYIAQGIPRAQIADLLSITDDTVKYRIKSACKKLKASTVTQATVKAALAQEIQPFDIEFEG